MRNYGSEAVQEAVPAEVARPAREAGLVPDLVVPVGQAAVTGALVGALAVFVLGEVAPAVRVDGLKLWSGLALGVSALTWLVLLRQSRRLLWSLERWTGADLDKNGVVGEPACVRVELSRDNQTLLFDLPGSEQALGTLARAVLGGRSLAEASWCGAGGLFTVGQFRRLRDVLIERGLAVWRNPEAPAQGWELMAGGRAVFRKLAEL